MSVFIVFIFMCRSNCVFIFRREIVYLGAPQAHDVCNYIDVLVKYQFRLVHTYRHN